MNGAPEYLKLIMKLLDCAPNKPEAKKYLFKTVTSPAILSGYLKQKRTISFKAGLELVTALSTYLNRSEDLRIPKMFSCTFKIQYLDKNKILITKIQILFSQLYLKTTYEEIIKNNTKKAEPNKSLAGGNKLFNPGGLADLEVPEI